MAENIVSGASDACSADANRKAAQKALLAKKYYGELLVIQDGRIVEHGLDHSSIMSKSRKYTNKEVFLQYVPKLDEFTPPFIY